MKLLVATTQTLGQRQNDFCWATPGEILHFGSECDREGIDGACGCKRSLSGLDSLKATTTMIVAEVEISDNELRNRLRAHFINDWGMDDAAATEWARVEVVQLMDLGTAFETGDVLERRGSTIRLRRGAAMLSKDYFQDIQESVRQSGDALVVHNLRLSLRKALQAAIELNQLIEELNDLKDSYPPEVWAQM